MTTAVDAYTEAREIQLKLARASYPMFLRWVVTEDADGYAVPAPVKVAQRTDPLLPQIISGEFRPRPNPFPHVEEMATDWQSGRSIIYLKARQMWFSWNVAAYALFKAMERGNVFVLSQGQEYADAVIDKARFIYDRLPRELKKDLQKSNTREMSFRNAGSIKSFPSTKDAVRSLSGRLVIVDEAAFHDYGAENYRAYRPSISGENGQLIMISTANGPHGFFHTMFSEAMEGRNDYDWRFYPWTARPDRDRTWYEREKRAYSGFISDFLRENPASTDEAFAQLSGVVYASWNPEVHVAPSKVPFEQCHFRLAGLDFGGSAGNPNAVTILGVTKDGNVHQYAEFAPPGDLTLDEIGGFIYQWHKKAPLLSVECDWQRSAITTLRKQFSLPARPAEKRREGLHITDFLLKNNRLTIDPSCTQSISEFYGYRWREALDPNSRERYQTKTPVDHHADLMDARRYALSRMWKQIMLLSGTVTNTEGRPPARSAV